MFTGIVEAIGTVAEVAPTPNGRRLRMVAPGVLDGLAVGASVAVDGACLTAAALHPDGFSVDVIAPTLERTIVGAYERGTAVNLERALRLGDRLDGHLVQGHVDAVGEVLAVTDAGDTRLVDLALPDHVDRVTILHGSITVNGVSLTVSELPEPGRCRVALIPHTRAATTLGTLAPGDRVNLEGDLIGKYVGRWVAASPRRAAPGTAPDPDPTP